MLTLFDLRKNKELINCIDWNMTPEKAVDMFLEWGSGWTRGNEFVRGNDEKIYFVLFDWEEKPQATLIKRNMQGATELAKVCVPSDLFEDACREDGFKAGGTVHPLSDTLKQWVTAVLGDAPENLQ